jgi:hypothetical protein
MNKKLFFSVILVLILVFGMTVIGCGDDDSTNTGEVRKTDLIISDTGGANGEFFLQISDISTVSWKSGITGNDVLSWLDISAASANLGYGDFSGLQVDSVEYSQSIVLKITISYTSQINPGGAFASSMGAIVAIKDDAATLSAIKAKTDGVESLEVKTQNKTATKLLLKRT